MEYIVGIENAFKKYIEEFDNGIFINDAYYYLAYSYLNTGDSAATSFCFSYLVENKVAMYLENSLIYLARNYFNKKKHATMSGNSSAIHGSRVIQDPPR